MIKEGLPLINEKESFIKALHTWYHNTHRKLPWRETPSLYKTVVSEFMLQQTQVDTVLPYFHNWLKIFPDFQALAHADEDAVVKQWEGLGYYRRAKNLHKLAKNLVFLETIPTDPLSWNKFPGVGPYTSAAITSIAFGFPSAVVDGNVIRILSRLCCIKTQFKDNNQAVKNLTELANAVLCSKDPNTHNQAVMELGATICTKANPKCTVCPVVNLCQGAKQGIAHTIPSFTPRKTENITIDRLWLEYDGMLLLHKISATSKRLANMYELPKREGILTHIGHQTLLFTKKRGISNQRITENIYLTSHLTQSDIDRILKEAVNLIWIKKEALDSITLSGPHKKWINLLLPLKTD